MNDTHPPEYSGVIEIKNNEIKIQTIAKTNHFLKILSEVKNNSTELNKIGIDK